MLCRHVPEFMSEIKELSYIFSAQDSELDFVDKVVKQSLDNSFIMFADSSGLARWENLFKTKSRDEILARLLDKLPYTYNTLDETLTVLYGVDGKPHHTLAVDCLNFTVTVGLHPRLIETTSVIERLIKRQIPANMVLHNFGFMFNQHKYLREYTHGFLNTKTYLDIKRRNL